MACPHLLPKESQVLEFIQWYFEAIASAWGGDGVDKFGAIVLTVIGLVVLAAILGVIYLIVRSIAKRIKWVNERQQCQHCQAWTTNFSDGHYPDCMSDEACCAACTHAHEMEHEDKIPCPVDGELMLKESINGELIKDVCPSGHGVWLAHDELAAIEQAAYDRGLSDGRSAGMATGLAIGIST